MNSIFKSKDRPISIINVLNTRPKRERLSFWELLSRVVKPKARSQTDPWESVAVQHLCRALRGTSPSGPLTLFVHPPSTFFFRKQYPLPLPFSSMMATILWFFTKLCKARYRLYRGRFFQRIQENLLQDLFEPTRCTHFCSARNARFSQYLTIV